MIQLTKKDLEQCKQLHSEGNHHNKNGTLYLDEQKKIIYKLIEADYFFPDETKRNIKYQIENPIPNSPTIIDEIEVDGKFGYAMSYIENSISFRDAIGLDIPDELKMKAILDIFQTIKYLHSQDITLGDIHLDNFLINPEGGHVIDLDYMRFPGDEFKFQTCYDIVIADKKYTKADKYTDSIKVMIAALSLIFNDDLETRIIDRNNFQMYDLRIPIAATEDENLINYFDNLIENYELHYFDDFLRGENPSRNKKV